VGDGLFAGGHHPSTPWLVRTNTTVRDVTGIGFCDAGSNGYTAWRSVKRPTTAETAA